MTGKAEATRVWLNKWGRIIFGTWLMTVSVALLVVSFDVRATGDAQERLAAEANLAAGVNCVRTMTAGAYSTADARRRGVYPPELQDWLERAIPKTCPTIPKSEMPPTVTTPWPAP